MQAKINMMKSIKKFCRQMTTFNAKMPQFVMRTYGLSAVAVMADNERTVAV